MPSKTFPLSPFKNSTSTRRTILVKLMSHYLLIEFYLSLSLSLGYIFFFYVYVNPFVGTRKFSMKLLDILMKVYFSFFFFLRSLSLILIKTWFIFRVFFLHSLNICWDVFFLLKYLLRLNHLQIFFYQFSEFFKINLTIKQTFK